ncbi:ATP-binding protein [Solicola sp. PLA-1-18]|uniref:sensor histidine kinase n=1 Tax=Solicola sp. PLA-1-18 TaxID=3380532 RepID=UPI003B7739EC
MLGTMRRRVLALTTGTTAIVLVLLAVPLAVTIRDQLIEGSTREASLLAQSVADYLSTGRYDEEQLDAYLARQGRRDQVSLQVELPDGTEVGDTFPQDVTGTDRAGRRGGGRGDGDRDGRGRDRDGDGLGEVSTATESATAQGRLVEVTASATGGIAVVRAYADDDELAAGVTARWALIAGVCLLLLVASAVGAELVSRRLVRPLDSAADTADRLSAGDLAARAPEGGPREVAAVGVALNALADRIGDLMAAERETVADLSHRMRTPLTAVRLDVEALPPGPRTDDLTEHVAQLERTLTAVIRAARRRPERADSSRSDLAATARDRVAFWLPLLEDQGREVQVDVVNRPVWTRCEEGDLTATLDALLENVIAHTAEGTALSVQVAVDDDRVQPMARVDVIDEGPGIPDAARERGHSDRGSTGLGLDIARRCAESGGGTLEISRPDGRTRVRLAVPLAEAPPPAAV